MSLHPIPIVLLVSGVSLMAAGVICATTFTGVYKSICVPFITGGVLSIIFSMDSAQCNRINAIGEQR